MRRVHLQLRLPSRIAKPLITSARICPASGRATPALFVVSLTTYAPVFATCVPSVVSLATCAPSVVSFAAPAPPASAIAIVVAVAVGLARAQVLCSMPSSFSLIVMPFVISTAAMRASVRIRRRAKRPRMVNNRPPSVRRTLR